MKFATKTIHAGQEPETTTGAIMTPIYQTSTYAQTGMGEHKGYEYARTEATRPVARWRRVLPHSKTESTASPSPLAWRQRMLF